MDNVEKMDQLIKMYKLSNINQKVIQNRNRTITNNEIESVVKIPTNKSVGTESFTGEFYQIFEEELALTLLRLFQKTEEKGIVILLRPALP